MVPTPIRQIINAIGMIEVHGTKYIPAIAAPVHDRQHRLIPRPDSLIYSNLRATVVALANLDTPERYRRAFENANPIPGFIWDEHVFS